MGRFDDLLDDLRLSRGGRGAEAFFGLLRGGHHAAPLLSEALSDPDMRVKVAQIIAESPLRAIIAVAAASRAVRAAVEPLVSAMAPAYVLDVAWQLAGQGTPEADQALQYLSPLVEAAYATAPPSSIDRIRGGRARFRLMAMAGDYEGGLVLLTGLLAACCPAGGVPDGEVAALLPEVAAGLEEAIGAAGDWPAAFEAVPHLHRAGLDREASRLLARALVSLPEEASGEHLACLLLELDPGRAEERERVAELLRTAWGESAAVVDARQSARGGYFGTALAGIGSHVQRVKDLLEDPLTVLGLSPDIDELCQDAAARVARLMEELVAFQPLRPEDSDPHQIALEVALACKDELGAVGLQLSVARPGGADGMVASEATVSIDPALTKALLRVTLRGLAAGAVARGHAGADGGPGRGLAITLAGHVSEETVACCRGAEFALSIEASGKKDGRGGGRGRKAVDGLAGLVAGVLSEGTLPDILARCSGAAAVTAPDGGDRRAVLRVLLPEVDPTASCGLGGEQETFEDVVSAIIEGTSPLETAALAIASHFSGLVRRELDLWGKDLALVLHDLKNSLAFVRGWLREDSVYDSETVRSRCLENIEDLEFWLSEAGAMLERDGAAGSYVDVGAITGRVLRGLAAVMARQQQTLQFDSEGQLPKVPASPFAVASIVRNLAKNAIEAMPGGGALLVTVAHDPVRSAVVVEVRDEGPGFPAELVTGTAGPEVSDGLSRPHLGLATVRRLLGEQGGELALRNDGGGVAIASFATGSGTAGFAAGVAGWGDLLEDTRRALRAARAMDQAGDTDTARHLWAAAIGLESAAAFSWVRSHELLPLTLEVANGSPVRPQPKPALRGAVLRLLGDDAWPKAEAAARKLFGRILQGKMEVKDLGVAETALLLLVFGAIAGPQGGAPLGAGFPNRREAVRAGTALFRAAQALEGGASANAGQADAATAIEPVVLQALLALTSIRLSRPVD